ncbi:SDR family NAD(P)-dependent oxidoreductase [Acetobacter okinawensis]|uniref:SDR family NAD(P)-dependent oxidoreductase n=1 Tax=Acetobacter okinawensis TaxID=1076594 RepID=UPI001BAD4FF8|nr:SDR family NAD(P)-dependent oxidoreductase [Acetobacter okinawensis]MBS0966980.1 SDR family NAD(P)-dependent oxidoreductase [Acetobacter okinawensis]
MSLAIIAGAGSGLGHALLRRFAHGGYAATGFARTPCEGGELDVRAVDLANPAEVSEAVSALIECHGPPKIVVHNPAQLFIAPLMGTTALEFEDCWRSMVLSAFILAQAVMKPMIEAGGGTFIASGATASLRGGARFGAFASAKFALRGFVQSLAREYQPQGVHIAHIILDGIIDGERSRALHGLPPERMMNADELAEVYWQIAHQPQSTWTHEIDLRPQSEGF